MGANRAPAAPKEADPTARERGARARRRKRRDGSAGGQVMEGVVDRRRLATREKAVTRPPAAAVATARARVWAMAGGRVGSSRATCESEMRGALRGDRGGRR